MSIIGGKKRSVKNQKKASRRTNSVLSSWIGFVKKVQKEENIKSYKDAMMRAKTRKSEWKKTMKGGQEGEELSMSDDPTINMDEESSPLADQMPPVQGQLPRQDAIMEESTLVGGRKAKRSSRRRRASRKSRASRRR